MRLKKQGRTDGIVEVRFCGREVPCDTCVDVRGTEHGNVEIRCDEPAIVELVYEHPFGYSDDPVERNKCTQPFCSKCYRYLVRCHRRTENKLPALLDVLEEAGIET